LVLSVAHLSVQLGLGRREVEEGSFNFNITVAILNNIAINRFIFLNGVHVELFTPPPNRRGVISSSGLMTTSSIPKYLSPLTFYISFDHSFY
jgi:hypothetical protein